MPWLFEAGKLRNEVDSGREHIHAVVKELKLQESPKTSQDAKVMLPCHLQAEDS